MLLHPVSVPSTRAVFWEDGERLFLSSSQWVREIITHNLEVSLISTGPAHLGVGDRAEAEVTFENQGYGPAPAKDQIRVFASLQPEGTTSIRETVPLGGSRISLPTLMENETVSFPMSWRIPSSIDPGAYLLRVSAIGLGDTLAIDNTALTESVAVVIAARTVNLESSGTGLGSVDNLDPREVYPDKFPLSMIINPEPGYVFSAGFGFSQGVSPASLTTVVLDGTFEGRIYFEPTYETWAAANIASPADRGRGSVVGNNAWPNIFKYLLDIPLNTPTSGSALEITQPTGFSGPPVVEFRIVHGRENESFSLSMSEDLVDWSPVQPSTTYEGSWLLYQFNVDPSVSDRAFFRLEAP